MHIRSRNSLTLEALHAIEPAMRRARAEALARLFSDFVLLLARKIAQGASLLAGTGRDRPSPDRAAARLSQP